MVHFKFYLKSFSFIVDGLKISQLFFFFFREAVLNLDFIDWPEGSVSIHNCVCT